MIPIVQRLKKNSNEDDEDNDHHDVVPKIHEPWKVLEVFLDPIFHVE